MKVEMTFQQRGMIANLFRIRATRLRRISEQRSGSATKAELLTEAGYWEMEAEKLDDAEEPVSVSDKEPIRAGARSDIDNVDGPKPPSGGAS